MVKVSDVETPYAIICPTDGQVFLTKEEYMNQMMRPNRRWQCPKCGESPVDWDDDNYEKHMFPE